MATGAGLGERHESEVSGWLRSPVRCGDRHVVEDCVFYMVVLLEMDIVVLLVVDHARQGGIPTCRPRCS